MSPRGEPVREPESGCDNRPTEEDRVPAQDPAAAAGAEQTGGEISSTDQSRVGSTSLPQESAPPAVPQPHGVQGEVVPVSQPAARMPVRVDGSPQADARATGTLSSAPIVTEPVTQEPHPVSPSPVSVEPASARGESNQVVAPPNQPARPVDADVNRAEGGDSRGAARLQGGRSSLTQGEQAPVVSSEGGAENQSAETPQGETRPGTGDRRPMGELLRELSEEPPLRAGKMAPTGNDSEERLRGTDLALAKSDGSRQTVTKSGVEQASVENDSQPASLSVRTAVGDGVAASVAKFMLSSVTAAGATTGMADVASGAVAVQAGTTTTSSALAAGTSASPQVGGNPGGQSVFGLDAPTAFDDAARVLAASSGEGRHQVTLRLEPPELGQLRVQIRMQQQAMTMQVDADSPAVARLIESRLADLRDALAMHGIRMDRTDVVVRSPASSETPSQQQNSQQGGWAQQGRGMGEESTGWLANDGRRADSEGQSGPWQSDGGSEPDSETGVVVAEEVRTGMELTPTTELSLDLVA